MSEFYNDQWYDERWQSMPPVMRKLAADTVAKAISDEDKELIKRKHSECGHDWIHHLIDVPENEFEVYSRVLGADAGTVKTWSAHHGWGTGIRNLLRDEEFGAGIRDDDLPDAPYEDGDTHRCWDDFYVQAVEAAVGLRPA